ncbi:transposase [Thermodesulfobacteriota bacterium]
MARLARVVVPGYPHHVTQRGNRRQTTFFDNHDYRLYLEFLEDSCHKACVEIWAYCLMPNHVHLIVVPETEDGLRRSIGVAHQRYTREINARMNWSGYLWQGRFASFPMDESYLLATARYVELNPVQAGLVARPEDYAWSSARFHLGLDENPVVCRSPLREMVPSWREYLSDVPDETTLTKIKHASRTGRPLFGDTQFVCPQSVDKLCVPACKDPDRAFLGL